MIQARYRRLWPFAAIAVAVASNVAACSVKRG